MHFQTLETLPSLGRVPKKWLLPPWLLAFAGGLFAVIGTFAVGRGVNHHLVVWPISGILIALLLPNMSARHLRRLFSYFAGGAGVFAGGLLTGMPWWLAALVSALTILDLGVAGLLLSPHVRTFEDLKQRRNVSRLVLASIFAPLLTGLVGGLRVAAFLKTPPMMILAMSTLADALGIAIFVPLTLFITTGKLLLLRRSLPNLLPLVLSCAFFTVVCVGTFWQDIGPYLFLIFPAMIGLLLTAGLEGVLFSSTLIVIVGSFATAHGHGPICLVRTFSPELKLITLQVFIWVSVVTALPVAAALDERRKAELTATTSRSVQEAILRHTREAIILSSLDGHERYASPAIEQITGWTPSEYTSFDRIQTVHPDDRANVREMLESLHCGVRNTSIRYRIMHKDGQSSWVEASVSVYGEDHTEGYVGTVRDISRLIETEQNWIQDRRVASEEQQRLAEAENAARFQIKLRDEFLSHVSHELRSPLTSILSFSSIIADGLAGETTSEQNEYLAIILKNVDQLQSMIEDLLTVTQSKEGKLNIELQAVSIKEAVVDALDTIRGFANRKHIDLTVGSIDDFPLIFADPIRVRQTLIILLDNAVKFTPEGGKVSVAISLHNPGSVLIRIIDTGYGIPEGKWNLIFEKLYQVEGADRRDTTAAGRTGLGLGLHIARSLVIRQSGLIWVTSVPDKGSVFHFTLPIYSQQDLSGQVDADTWQTLSEHPDELSTCA